MKKFEKKALNKKQEKKEASIVKAVKTAGAIALGVGTVIVGVGKLIVDSKKK